MKQNSHSENLMPYLDQFIRQMQQLNKADNPKLVSKLVMQWTKGQPLLTKKLLQYILQSKQKITRGKEALVIERIIRTRLLKEFKQDNLTLNIRKFLYKINLEQILKQTGKKITATEQASLWELQRELGLSNQQCRTIKENTLIVSYFSNTAPKKQAQKQKNQQHYSGNQDTNIKLKASLTNLNSKQQKSALLVQTNISENKQINKSKTLRKPWVLLLLVTSLIFLVIKGWGWNRRVQINIVNNPLEQQQQPCLDLTSNQSPRMSLGEKLLTPEYNHLQPASVLSLYEGSTAFARCEFVTAKNKFQQSLAINKNNPEALIYLNNVTAINQDHLKIAVSVPLGKDSEIAWEILRGVAQAQAEINERGGIKQKLLLVQIVDDKNDPEITYQVAEKLAADKTILAVVGHNASNASLAGSKVYQKQGLVMISPTSSTTELSGRGNYILRTAFSVTALTNALADYASVKSWRNITICFDSDSSASTSFVREFVSEMTQDEARETAVKCDFAQRDFNPKLMVQQAISENSDALLLVPSLTRIGHAILVAQANQQQLPLLGNHSLYTLETIEQGQAAVTGMVLPSPWLPDVNSNSDFLQTATKYWGGTVNWRTATAYDATMTIIQGLEQSNNRSELQSVLNKPDFVVDGVTGKFSFEQGDRFGKAHLAYVQKSNKNSGEYQFSQLKLNK